MIILCSLNPTVRERWKDALHISPLREVDELDGLKRLLDTGEPVLILLHLSLPHLNGLAGIKALRRDYPQTRILVFSDCPNDNEGLPLLKEGIYGYCNTYIAPPLLTRAVEAIEEDGVWVGWSLIQRLIQANGLVRGLQEDTEKAQRTLSNLTEREKEIAMNVARGLSNKRIASSLGIAERTVKAHLGSAFQKTGVRDRLHLALLIRDLMA